MLSLNPFSCPKCRQKIPIFYPKAKSIRRGQGLPTILVCPYCDQLCAQKINIRTAIWSWPLTALAVVAILALGRNIDWTPTISINNPALDGIINGALYGACLGLTFGLVLSVGIRSGYRLIIADNLDQPLDVKATGQIKVHGYLKVLSLFAVIALAAGYFVYQNYHDKLLIKSQMEMPFEFKVPSVLTGQGFISKKILIEDNRLGDISDIIYRKCNGDKKVELGVAGSKGVLYLDYTENTRSFVQFNSRADHVNIIDLEGNNICEYMNRGSWAIPASLIGPNGKVKWTYGEGMPGVDDMAVGDIDGDGKKEFVVGFNGDGGVHLLDKDGNLKWKQEDGNVWHVEIAGTNGNEKNEIIHSNAGGKIVLRDKTGKLIRESKSPSSYFSRFSLAKWPGKENRQYALQADCVFR